MSSEDPGAAERPAPAGGSWSLGALWPVLLPAVVLALLCLLLLLRS